jgi:metal-responsive CopG/Arc/MetJ family transcriptional regulator
MKRVSLRVEREILEELERISKKRDVNRSVVIREMLLEGIREYKLREALELLRERKITVWRAAEMVGVTYREILDKMKQHNIPFPLTLDEIKREIKEISSK